jgi:hypothetical protein
MEAGADGGTLTTRPVRFSGEHLFVNMDCPEGKMVVDVLDEQDRPVEGFAAEGCEPVSTDSTLVRVVWRNGASLAKLAGKPVRFRFHLTAGSLYSFWVSPDTDGCSHGYLAAGGPGYPKLTDTVGRKGLEAAKALGPLPSATAYQEPPSRATDSRGCSFFLLTDKCKYVYYPAGLLNR